MTGGQASTPEGLPQQQNSSAVLPGYLGLPFQIIVSPFARFDPISRSTDILMFNSRNLGALVVKEDPHVQNWEDARYGIALNMPDSALCRKKGGKNLGGSTRGEHCVLINATIRECYRRSRC